MVVVVVVVLEMGTSTVTVASALTFVQGLLTRHQPSWFRGRQSSREGDACVTNERACNWVKPVQFSSCAVHKLLT